MKTWSEQGEAAFPVPDGEVIRGEYGMSLRDYIATAALTGILANPNRTMIDIEVTAYRIADEMLAERVK